MKIAKVTSDDHSVRIETREDDNPFSSLGTINVNIMRGLNITFKKGNETIPLIVEGEIEPRPLDRMVLNTIDSQLESALKLFREVTQEESDEDQTS